MKKIDIFDPPMCCSTGLCGPSIDPELVRFSADLSWLKKQGVTVGRYNLSQEPAVFSANDEVKAALAKNGNDCLPLTLADGVVVSQGKYPTRDELTNYAGIDVAQRHLSDSLPVATEAPCCDGGTGNSSSGKCCG